MSRHNSHKGIIFDLKRFAIHDGPGIRTTVFFKGCPLRCWWCHNPESHKLLPEKFDGCNMRRGINHSLSGEEDEVGRTVTVEEIITEIEKDRIFYEESGGGVTFSGGEPLMQPEFLIELLEECKNYNFHSTIDTSGYASSEIIKSIAPHTNLFLYDLKLMDVEEHKKYTGVSNSRIHQNLEILDRLGKKIIIRIPVVPGITDSEENLIQLRDFISNLKNILGIDLLPYHQAGEGKYKKFRRESRLGNITIPGNGYIEKIKEKFSGLNCKVKIGG